MELKVLVEGVPRVVCGVTAKTTCQEVVVALAKSLSRPGRYTMVEKFKEFERSVTPNEHILESLGKYGPQMREVQLTLLHNGPSLWEEISRSKHGPYQPCPQIRKTGAGVTKDSGSLSLHRQSLPPLSRMRQQGENQPEEIKHVKRKSLTQMEEAWGWLGSLGRRGGMYQLGGDKDRDKRNSSPLEVSVSTAEDTQSLSRNWRLKGEKSSAYQRTSCCIGEQRRDTNGKLYKKLSEAGTTNRNTNDLQRPGSASKIEDEKRKLRETFKLQLDILQDLQLKIMSTDTQIMEFEEQQQSEQKAQQRIMEEEMEQEQLWENELKAEEVYEKDLQGQFLDIKANAAECKVRLEEYKHKMQGLHFSGVQKVFPEQQESVPTTKGESPPPAKQITTVASKTAQSQLGSIPASEVASDRKFPPREDSNLPHTLPPPSQIKDRRPTGPRELREWWSRWSEAHSPKTETQPAAVLHRSELTVHLGGSRV
ncbi:uncharacterized protein rassf11 [Aplochiton taeniatus]